MRLKSQNFQKVQRIHRWLGLFLSLHILVLAITGAILVFHDELAPSPPARPPVAKPVSLQALVDQSLKLHPKDRLLAIGVDHEDTQKVSLRLGPDGSPKFRGARRLSFDRRDGSIQSQTSKGSGLLNKILILHREIFLGTFGKLYVGTVGLIYGFVLISGMFIYGPMLKRIRFGTLHSQLHPRQWWANVHKYFGAMTFAWSLVIGLSGFLLGWGGPIIKFYQASALQDLVAEFSAHQEPRPFVSVDQALQAATHAIPEGHFSFVAFPGSEFSTAHHYIFVMDGHTPLTQRLSDMVVVNAYDGRLERVLPQPWYLQLLLLSEPLHFGDYGGLAMKILWVIFALFSMVLPLSGLRVFVQKYRKEIREKRSIWTGGRPRKPERHRPYALPLLLMGLSWTGLGLALLEEGIGDAWANLCLGMALILSLWYLVRNNRAVSPE